MRQHYGIGQYTLRDIPPVDWLLIAGVIMAPMTGFRVWKVGPGELLCLLWGLHALLSGRVFLDSLSRFVGGFYVALILGTVFGAFIAPRQLRIEQLATWFYLGFTAILLESGLRGRDARYVEFLLRVIASFGVLWFLFLYVYSRSVSPSFLGAPLWYNRRRFAGGGTNPHQVAVFFCVVAFVFTREIIRRRRIVLNAALFAADMFLLLETQSSTGELAVALGLAVTLYFLFAELFPHHKGLVFLGVTTFLFVVVLLGWDLLVRLFLDWVSEDANGLGRLRIFASFPKAFAKSPVFGLGPGTHGVNGTIEFHNMYLEIFAATGLVGGTIFLVYLFRLGVRLFKTEWTLLPILVALCGFGLAGFAARRLIFWCLLALLSAYVESVYAVSRLPIMDEMPPQPESEPGGSSPAREQPPLPQVAGEPEPGPDEERVRKEVLDKLLREARELMEHGIDTGI